MYADRLAPSYPILGIFKKNLKAVIFKNFCLPFALEYLCANF